MMVFYERNIGRNKKENIYYEFVMDKILKIFKKEFYSDYLSNLTFINYKNIFSRISMK